MSKRKSLSVDEKRQKMLDFFYETKDFYQLKDLEKILPKQKGIVAQTVKDVLEGLVADNLVQAEKVGSSNYFWSFPSAAGQVRKANLNKLETELKELQLKKNDLEAKIQQLLVGREESEARSQMLSEFNEKTAIKENLEQELQLFKDCDPVELAKKENAAMEAIQHANRWTENIFAVKSYCVRKFNMESKAFDKSFGISADFDLIE